MQILTRRGGTDASTPESPRKAILRDGMLAFWLPIFWKFDHTSPSVIPLLSSLDSQVHDWGGSWTVWAEDWVVDIISARRNRCERSRKPPKGYMARLACWDVGTPNFGKCPKNNSNKYRKVVRNRSVSKEMGGELAEKEQHLAADLFQGFPAPKPMKNIEK